MLGVDEGADAALLLGFGDGVQRERGLAGGFGPVDLDHAAARQAADAERDVEAERAGRDGLDVHRLVVLAEPHDRALAEGALDLRQRGVERLCLVHGGAPSTTRNAGWGHVILLLMTMILRVDNARMRAVPLKAGNVHYLFSVRNMFFLVAGYWPLSMVAGPF